jgi:hypothetical protein
MLMDNVCQPPETHHLWIWINEPQHSAAIQALLGIVTTIASLAAAFAALKAYLKTVDQVRIANQQLEVARRQANAAQRPFLVIESAMRLGIDISQLQTCLRANKYMDQIAAGSKNHARRRCRSF